MNFGWYSWALGSQTISTNGVTGMFASQSNERPYVDYLNSGITSHSDSQIWAIASGWPCLSDVETGWISSLGGFHDTRPHLFMFAWDCGKSLGYVGQESIPWVQVSNVVYPNMALSYNDTWHTYGVTIEQGNWWFYYDGYWVGYIPGSAWNPETVPGYLHEIKAGGEVSSGSEISCTDMGFEGRYGSDPKAAMYNQVWYVLDGFSANASLAPYAPDPNYTIGSWYPGNPGYRFRYGGPGGCGNSSEPPKPVATTGTASVKSSSAEVQGVVQPSYGNTNYWFEYGLTTAYGSSNPPMPGAFAGNDGGSHSVSAQLSGLTPGTTYHYRLVATNEEGTSYGSDSVLTTVGPPSVETGGGEQGSKRSAALFGTVNPNRGSTQYQFEYGTTTAYGKVMPVPAAELAAGTSPVAVSTVISELEPETTYHYRLSATNEGGATKGADRTFTTTFWPEYSRSLGSYGSENGQFKNPADVATDSEGNLWVVDKNNTRVEEFSESGKYLSKFGTSGGGEGQFVSPSSAAFDSKGNIWVTDWFHPVQGFNKEGKYIGKFSSIGTGEGQVKDPSGLAIDAKDNFWVADKSNNRILEFNSEGKFVKVVASSGSGAGQVLAPVGIDVGPGGNVWVADKGNNQVDEYSESGAFVKSFGSEGTGPGQFKGPAGISVDARGVVWVIDEGNSRVETFSEAGNFLTQFGAKGSGEGQFTFSGLMGLAADNKGGVWVTDTGDSRLEKWVR